MYKKIGGLALALIMPSVFAQQLQPANEVQVQNQVKVQNQGESDMIDPIDGCHPKIKQSCQARIVCTGSSTIHGDNPRAIQVAMKVAQSNANGELAKYLGNKTKVNEDIKQLDRTYSKESGAGKQTQSELGILVSQVNSTSAEQFLQGVAVIGGKVDIPAGKVSVVVGQGCESVAAAQGMSQKMQQGQAQQSGASSSTSSQGAEAMGGPQIHYGTGGSVIQRPKDDF